MAEHGGHVLKYGQGPGIIRAIDPENTAMIERLISMKGDVELREIIKVAVHHIQKQAHLTVGHVRQGAVLNGLHKTGLVKKRLRASHQ